MLASAQTPTSTSPDYGRYNSGLLRDLPTGGNLFAVLETAQPEVVTDRFNGGGLNAGDAARAGAFLASWSQTEYRVGDVSISSPVDGTPLLFPEVAWWNEVQVATGLMPADATASGLLVSLDPRRPNPRWTTSVDGSISGGALTQPGSASRPAPIAQLNDWSHAHVMTSGTAIDGRLGVVAGGSWTNTTRFERNGPAPLSERTHSLFAHTVFTLSPKREARALMWIQRGHEPFELADLYRQPSARTATRSLHLQGTLSQRTPGEPQWRIFGGYTTRSREPEIEPIDGFVADRLVDGPIPALITNNSVTDRRWSVGARISPAWRSPRHTLDAGGNLEGTSSAAGLPFPGTIGERVDGLPARTWHYTHAGLESHRRATLVTAFAHDRISISPEVTIEAALRFESAHGGASGATDGIAWHTWLPSARLAWVLGTPLQLRLVTGVARSTNQLMLGLLAHGDPAAPAARVFRWDGATPTTTLVARVGPGTGGDPAFSQIDSRLKRPITGEFAIGLESAPKPALRLSVMGFARRETSLINVVNIGVPVGSYTTFTIPDANADLVGPADDQQLVVYNQRPESFGEDRYLLTNPGQDAATTGALVISASSSTERLFLQVGATAAAAVGSGGNRGFRALENDQDALGELFTTPNAQSYARGRLFNDRAYTIKWTTVYHFPWDLRVGALARYQDGQPFSRMVVVPGLNQGTEAIQAFANGRSRFAFTGTLDVRVQKGIAAGPVRVDLILDAYNVLNMSKEVEE